MDYSIAFNGLPFEPDSKQVIFVENQFDDRINAIIKENYHKIVFYFERANLEFIYLPMLFTDELIKEKIIYYAPYLSSEIMEKIELQSSHILGYMSTLEGTDVIPPSLLYAPRKEKDEWIFRGHNIDISKDDKYTVALWFDRFVNSLENISKPGPQDDDECLYFSVKEELTEPTKVKRSSFWKSVILNKIMKFSKCMVEEDECGASESPKTIPNEIPQYDIYDYVASFEGDAKQLLLLGLSPSALHELIDKLEIVSRLHITEDLRITLPDYNDIEVQMSALYKAVYFLFLNHPEGIVLQRLEEYHHELMNYYCQTSKKKDPSPQMIDAINRIEYPGNNSIHIVISRIKNAFYRTFDKHLAKRYIIIGTPGDPYRITLDQGLIEWGDECE